MEFLEDLKKKAKKASLGPWHIGHIADIDDFEGNNIGSINWRRDQIFVASANPQTILRLLDAYECLRDALDWYAAWDWSDKYVQPIPKKAVEALKKAEKILDGK